MTTSHKHEHKEKDVDSHSHGDIGELRNKSRKRLSAVALIVGTFMLAEIVFGVLTHSLAILADAGHLFGDIAAIVLALIANFFATKPATSEKTYGYYRSEILTSTFNSLCMLGMSGFIFFESYKRFSSPADIHGLPMIAIGVLGCIVNLVSMRLLVVDEHESLNNKAVYLELLSDMLASLGVVLAGVVIQFTGWVLIDSIVSMLIAVGLIPRTWSLLSQCVHILMEGTPQHVVINELRQAILSVNGVQDIHDLHVWTITSGLHAFSGHVLVIDGANTQSVLDQIAEICEHQFKIRHTTIQIDIAPCEGTHWH